MSLAKFDRLTLDEDCDEVTPDLSIQDDDDLHRGRCAERWEEAFRRCKDMLDPEDYRVLEEVDSEERFVEFLLELREDFGTSMPEGISRLLGETELFHPHFRDILDNFIVIMLPKSVTTGMAWGLTCLVVGILAQYVKQDDYVALEFAQMILNIRRQLTLVKRHTPRDEDMNPAEKQELRDCYIVILEALIQFWRDSIPRLRRMQAPARYQGFMHEYTRRALEESFTKNITAIRETENFLERYSNHIIFRQQPKQPSGAKSKIFPIHTVPPLITSPTLGVKDYNLTDTSTATLMTEKRYEGCIEMTRNQKRSKVYRVQGLPDRPGFDKYDATQLIASAINDPTLTAGDIKIYSLALVVDPHKMWNRNVATVMFNHTPSVLATEDGSNSSVASQWQFPVPGFPEPLVLDSHFLGLTVLNDVSAAEHRFDCIVLSGLASHPFGSWQPKGDNKSYMWIRDTLPTSIRGVRFILFGYDTTLKDSDSFQTIVDLSNSLYLTLQTNGWASPSTKPLLFLAHSLGGVLLKQLLVILAGANEKSQFMLSIIKGAIFFGTPSRGMALGQLLTMVGDQPNKDLVEDLSEMSNFLPNLETQFTDIAHLQRMRLYWAYETKTSPTVQMTDGIYKRSGPRSIMVDRQSATGSRTLDPWSTIQIDEGHSDMVKLNIGDRRIPIIMKKIREICSLGE